MSLSCMHLSHQISSFHLFFSHLLCCSWWNIWSIVSHPLSCSSWTFWGNVFHPLCCFMNLLEHCLSSFMLFSWTFWSIPTRPLCCSHEPFETLQLIVYVISHNLLGALCLSSFLLFFMKFWRSYLFNVMLFLTILWCIQHATQCMFLLYIYRIVVDNSEAVRREAVRRQQEEDAAEDAALGCCLGCLWSMFCCWLVHWGLPIDSTLL